MTIPWTPWHKVVNLRDDLRTGGLSLAVFAAEIYDVQKHISNWQSRVGCNRVYEKSGRWQK